MGAHETIRVSADHPWLVVHRGWVETHDLYAGDRVIRAGGADLVVQSLASTGRVEQTYNLTITGPHTYLVGAHHAVVHNGACKNLAARIAEWIGADARIFRWGRNNQNIRVESATRSFRMEFDDGAAHAHLQIRNARGAWVDAPGTPDHIFFEGQ